MNEKQAVESPELFAQTKQRLETKAAEDADAASHEQHNTIFVKSQEKKLDAMQKRNRCSRPKVVL